MNTENAQLREIAELAKRQVLCEEKVARAKQLLEQETNALRLVAEVLLPNAMLEAEMSSFTLDTGVVVEIKRDYATSISAANWPAAKAWLKSHDGDGVIKHVVSLAFGKGEDSDAESALTLLIQSGYAPEDKETIHPQTLKATVKAYINSGEDLPMDIFGVFEIVKAKVTLPK